MRNVEKVIAIELLAACQAIEFLRPLKTTAPLEEVYKAVRSVARPWDKDRCTMVKMICARLRDQQLCRNFMQVHVPRHRRREQAAEAGEGVAGGARPHGGVPHEPGTLFEVVATLQFPFSQPQSLLMNRTSRRACSAPRRTRSARSGPSCPGTARATAAAGRGRRRGGRASRRAMGGGERGRRRSRKMD